MSGRALSFWTMTAVLTVMVPAGMVWLFVEGLQHWEEGIPGGLLGPLLFVRVVASLGMLIALIFALWALVRAMTSRGAIITPNDAIAYYGLVVVYAGFGMLVPMIGAAFFEAAIHLAIALLLLLAVRLRIRAGGASIDIGPVTISPSRPDTRRAARLVLLATAAIVGATIAYGWLVLQGNVMGCFVRNCSTGLTLGVLGASSTAGILTAGVVLWSLRTRARVTTPGVIATTLYGCLALVALALPLSTFLSYDFFVVAVWHALAGLAFLVCQSRFEDDPWLLPIHLIMEEPELPVAAARRAV